MSEPVRIFIGCPSNGEDLESQAVLEWSLRKHATQELDITWMKLSKDPASFWYSNPTRNEGWLTRGWATPFSALRWGIPAACKFEGPAIYLDIDMIGMDDIGKLWGAKLPGEAFVMAKNRETFCCSLFDCQRARARLPDIGRIKREYGLYARLRRAFGIQHVAPFPKGENWNCLDGERYADIRDPVIKIVHCTNIPTQPQLAHALPRLAAAGRKHWSTFTPKPHPRRDIVALFDGLLEEARAHGYPPERYDTPDLFGDYHR